MQQIKKHSIKFHTIESEYHNQNAAEGVIREVRRRWFRLKILTNIPNRLWDYGLQWVCDLMQRTVNSRFDTKNRTPYEIVLGDTPDISEYMDFAFYSYIWFKEQAGLGDRILARFLGVSHKIGNSMCYFVLKSNGNVLSRSTVQPILFDELKTSTFLSQSKKYDEELQVILNNPNYIITDNSPPSYSEIQQDEDFLTEYRTALEENEVVKNNYTPDIDDPYINAEIALPRIGYENPQLAHVTKRLKNNDGNPVGIASSNPILDTRNYIVEFLDGHEEALQANLISEYMFSQINEEGHRQLLLDEIINHRNNPEKNDEVY